MTVSCRNDVSGGYQSATTEQEVQRPLMGLHLITTGSAQDVAFILQFTLEQTDGVVWDSVAVDPVPPTWAAPQVLLHHDDVIYDPDSGIYSTRDIPGLAISAQYQVRIQAHNDHSTLDEVYDFVVNSRIIDLEVTCPDVRDVEFRSGVPVMYKVAMLQGSSVHVDLDHGDGSNQSVYTGYLQ